MAIYKAIASTNWTTSTTWNEWNAVTSAWVAPFTAPLYPNTTSDTVYLNTFAPIVDTATITTAIITNEASIGLAPNTTLGGKLSITAASPAGGVTINASSSMTYASTSGATTFIDASARISYSLTINTPSISILVAAPFYTIGATGTSTIIGATVTWGPSATAASRLLTSSTLQTVYWDNVSMACTVAAGIQLTLSGSNITTLNNCNLQGSSSTALIYAIDMAASGTNYTVTLQGGTYTAGTAAPCIFLNYAATNLVKVQNDITAPTYNAKLVNNSTNGWMAIWGARIQVDNNITGWDFQPATTAGTTTLSPASVSYPATNDVRDGITYGLGTGTLKVPPASTVLLGTPVDATTGTLDIPNAVAQVVGNIVANLT